MGFFFDLYFDYIFILSGLDKNLKKTSKIKADLRIVKVVNFFYNLFARRTEEFLRTR